MVNPMVDVLMALLFFSKANRPPRHRCGAFLSPSSEYIPYRADCNLSAPENMNWTLNLFVGLIMCSVGACSVHPPLLRHQLTSTPRCIPAVP